MQQPLMPKATAVWLVENTGLTFEQIAEFCGLHVLEIESIADGESCNIVGLDPISSSQLTKEEIKRCEDDQNARLQMMVVKNVDDIIKKNKIKYTPIARRKDRPSAILWLVKYYPHISDARICEFLSSTRATVGSIRSKTYRNMQNIEPHSPAALGFCSQRELDDFINVETEKMMRR
jgi:hypothetical protein